MQWAEGNGGNGCGAWIGGLIRAKVVGVRLLRVGGLLGVWEDGDSYGLASRWAPYKGREPKSAHAPAACGAPANCLQVRPRLVLRLVRKGGGKPWGAKRVNQGDNITLAGHGAVVATLAIGKKAGVAEFALGVADDAVNRFTMRAFARLFLFGIGHDF